MSTDNTQPLQQPDTYLKTRLEELGISEDTPGFIQDISNSDEPFAHARKPLLHHDAEGNILIPYFDLQGQVLTYKKTDNPGNPMTVEYSVIRYRDAKLHGRKYKMPSRKATGGDMPLYLTPSIWAAYTQESKIDTLYLVEGQFKALSGWAQGLHIIGIEGFWGWKQGEKKHKLKQEIVDLISVCKPENVVLLLDADARQVKQATITAGKDLAERIKQFHAAVRAFSDVMLPYPPTAWVAQVHEGWLEEAKGLDDLIALHRPKNQVRNVCNALQVEDLTDPRNAFFQALKLGEDNELQAFFFLRSVHLFWEHYKEQIWGEKFIWKRGRYQAIQDDKGAWVVKQMRHPDADKYIRVGLDWFKFMHKPNQFGEVQRYMSPWRDTVIKQDCGNILDQCEKYDSFMNLPGGGASPYHKYAEMEDGTKLYNLFEEIPYQPDPTAPYPRTIFKFLKHIFGDFPLAPEKKGAKAHKRFKFAWDYLTILYNKPTQKLPIICLVSSENNTGKSTFINLLKKIWGNNVVKLGNEDFQTDFNSHWASKLVVGIEETLFEKPKYKEKLKAVTTDNYIGMRGLFKDKVEIDCSVHAVITSNHPDTFMPLQDEDERFIVIQVPQIKEVDPDFEEKMKAEIPRLLYILRKRWEDGKLTYKRKNRMWFAPHILRTPEFLRVVRRSRPGLQRAIEDYARNIMLDEEIENLYLSTRDLIREIEVKGNDRGYLKEVLVKKMKMKEPIKKARVLRAHIDPNKEQVGRYWHFKADDFLSPIELQALQESIAKKAAAKNAAENAGLLPDTDNPPF